MFDFQLDTLNVVEGETGPQPVDASTQNEFWHILRNKDSFLYEIFAGKRLYDLPDFWRARNDEGTKWTKRVSNAMWKYGYDTTPHANILAELGEFITRHSESQNRTFLFEITRYCDWTPGNFKEKNDSCWWGTFNTARLELFNDPRAHSILFYRDRAQFLDNQHSVGVGRCWSVIDKDKGYAAIFNAYGERLSTVAMVLSKMWNVQFAKARAQILGSYLNGGEINNEAGGGNNGIGTAYFLSNKDEWLPPLDIPCIADATPKIQCLTCNKVLPKAQALKVGVELYCKECFEKYFFKCGHCGVYTRLDRKQEAFGGNSGRNITICQVCFARYGFTCYVHGPSIGASYRVWHTNRTYCQTCAVKPLVVTCPSCNRLKDKFKPIPSLRYKGICISCLTTINKARKIEPERRTKLQTAS